MYDSTRGKKWRKRVKIWTKISIKIRKRQQMFLEYWLRNKIEIFYMKNIIHTLHLISYKILPLFFLYIKPFYLLILNGTSWDYLVQRRWEQKSWLNILFGLEKWEKYDFNEKEEKYFFSYLINKKRRKF